MKIPDELMQRWQDLKTYGDGKKIADANSDTVNEMDVSRAFNKGECTDTVFEAMAKFYKEKEVMIKQYL